MKFLFLLCVPLMCWSLQEILPNLYRYSLCFKVTWRQQCPDRWRDTNQEGLDWRQQEQAGWLWDNKDFLLSSPWKSRGEGRAVDVISWLPWLPGTGWPLRIGGQRTVQMTQQAPSRLPSDALVNLSTVLLGDVIPGYSARPTAL